MIHNHRLENMFFIDKISHGNQRWQKMILSRFSAPNSCLTNYLFALVITLNLCFYVLCKARSKERTLVHVTIVISISKTTHIIINDK